MLWLYLTINVNVIYPIFSVLLIINTSYCNFLDNYKTIQPDRLYCPNNCGRSYVGYQRKSNLKRHLMTACGVEPKFQCPICYKKYSQKSTMKTHRILVHKDICVL